jgi:hypothetical protein
VQLAARCGVDAVLLSPTHAEPSTCDCAGPVAVLDVARTRPCHSASVRSCSTTPLWRRHGPVRRSAR